MMRSCHECLSAKKREWSCSGGRYSHRKRYGMMRLRRRMVLSSCCMKIYRVDLTGMRRMQGTYMYRTCKRQMPQGEKIRGKRGRTCGICKRGRGNGALGGDRTHNPCLRRAVLYPLSYERVAATRFSGRALLHAPKMMQAVFYRICAVRDAVLTKKFAKTASCIKSCRCVREAGFSRNIF